jgi:hypothetical protein
MPVHTISTLGDTTIVAGRLSGVLGAHLLLIQVILMARIPWLERRIGSDWLAREHRVLGTYLLTNRCPGSARPRPAPQQVGAGG